MRYFVRLAYKGSNYFGWQRQPRQISVQQVIEETLSKMLSRPIEVTGCGRTDTGVHASDYVLHFDSQSDLPNNFLYRVNKMLPDDIAFYVVKAVHDDAHARYDAISRSYEYRIGLFKDPFLKDFRWNYPYDYQTDWSLVQEAAQLITPYKAFFPFCKSNTDVKTMNCDIRSSHWQYNSDRKEWVYAIEADRFLRGMIRLIVGMCVTVGRNKLSLSDVKTALENQTRLPIPLSAPPEGLYLKAINYSYF